MRIRVYMYTCAYAYMRTRARAQTHTYIRTHARARAPRRARVRESCVESYRSRRYNIKNTIYILYVDYLRNVIYVALIRKTPLQMQ